MAKVSGELSDEHWCLHQTTGPVRLARRWMQRQGWMETGLPWLWAHTEASVVLQLSTAPVPQQFRQAHLRLLTPTVKGQLEHVLREAWRANCWRLFMASDNKAAQLLTGLSWPQVAGQAKSMRTILSKNTDSFRHIIAIASGHYVSTARFFSTQGLPVPACGCGNACPDRAHEWVCAHRCGVAAPMQPQGSLQAVLAWPAPAQLRSCADSERFMAQVVNVRRRVLNARYTQTDGEE